MPNSLEKACEDFFVLLLRANSRLSGKTVVHFEEESEAPTKGIVVQAKQGAHVLVATGGYEVEVTIEYRAPGKTSKAENDQATAAIHEIVYDSTLSPTVRRQMAIDAGLSDLLIKDESTGDRQNTSDLRKRVITIPLQAKLA